MNGDQRQETATIDFSVLWDFDLFHSSRIYIHTIIWKCIYHFDLICMHASYYIYIYVCIYGDARLLHSFLVFLYPSFPDASRTISSRLIHLLLLLMC